MTTMPTCQTAESTPQSYVSFDDRVVAAINEFGPKNVRAVTYKEFVEEGYGVSWEDFRNRLRESRPERYRGLDRDGRPSYEPAVIAIVGMVFPLNKPTHYVDFVDFLDYRILLKRIPNAGNDSAASAV